MNFFVINFLLIVDFHAKFNLPLKYLGSVKILCDSFLAHLDLPPVVQCFNDLPPPKKKRSHIF